MENVTINQLMRELRNKNKKSLESVAEELGVSRQTISNWESGKSTPDGVSLMEFLKTYDPSLGEFGKLLKGKNKKDNPANDSQVQRELYNVLREQARKYFSDRKLGFGNCHIEIDDFVTYISEKGFSGDKSLSDSLFIQYLNLLLYADDVEYDIDQSLICLEFALKLKHAGYVVANVYPQHRGSAVDVFITNKEQGEKIGELLLEHLIIEEERTAGLTAAEAFTLKAIQEEYNRIKSQLDKVEKEKIKPLADELEYNEEDLDTLEFLYKHFSKDPDSLIGVFDTVKADSFKGDDFKDFDFGETFAGWGRVINDFVLLLDDTSRKDDVINAYNRNKKRIEDIKWR